MTDAEKLHIALTALRLIADMGGYTAGIAQDALRAIGSDK